MSFIIVKTLRSCRQVHKLSSLRFKEYFCHVLFRYIYILRFYLHSSHTHIDMWYKYSGECDNFFQIVDNFNRAIFASLGPFPYMNSTRVVGPSLFMIVILTFIRKRVYIETGPFLDVCVAFLSHYRIWIYCSNHPGVSIRPSIIHRP